MFDLDFAAQVMPKLLSALWITVYAAFGGMVLALALGLAWTIARRSQLGVVSWPAACVVEFVRSTPLLIQIYFIFYALPSLGLRLSPLMTGMVALGLHYSAYTSEVYRAGIEGVPRGQWEASKALNLSPVHTFRHVILPQAIPSSLPALGNYLVAMFKDTPILSSITVLEMLQTAKLVGAETFRYLEPLTLVGVLFLALSLCSACLIRWLEHRLVLRTA